MNESKYRWTLILTAGLVPFAVLIYFIFRFHVNVPFGDEWEIAAYLENWDAGQMSVAHLWKQHNEHRIFFPRIIILFIAKLTRWNLLYEDLLNASLAALTYGMLAYYCLRLEKWGGRFYMACLVAVLPWIVFSARQWENWTWGIQLVCFLGTFSMVAGLAMLATRPVTWGRALTAIALGVLSHYSFASGFAYWPTGLGLLWFAVYVDSPKRWQVLAAWGAAALFFSALFLWGYHKPSHHPALSYCLAHPLEFTSYVLMYLGALLNIGRGQFAIFLGVLGLVFYIVSFVWLYRENKVPKNLLAGAASFGFYAIMNALMAGVGRVGFQEDGQALSSRYVTISYPFWVSTLILGALFFCSISNRCVSSIQKILVRRTQILLFVVLGLVLLQTARSSLGPWRERHELLESAREQILRSGEEVSALHPLVPQKHIPRVQKSIKYLRNQKISLYAE